MLQNPEKLEISRSSTSNKSQAKQLESPAPFYNNLYLALAHWVAYSSGSNYDIEGLGSNLGYFYWCRRTKGTMNYENHI